MNVLLLLTKEPLLSEESSALRSKTDSLGPPTAGVTQLRIQPWGWAALGSQVTSSILRHTDMCQPQGSPGLFLWGFLEMENEPPILDRLSDGLPRGGRVRG